MEVIAEGKEEEAQVHWSPQATALRPPEVQAWLPHIPNGQEICVRA
jgi:hypothetical protein